jgi:acetyl-CoA acetyltransferase
MGVTVESVFIAGVGMTKFGKFPDRPIRSLTEEATKAALQNAQVAPDDVGIVFFSNAAAGLVTGQEMIPGQVALRQTGLLGLPIINVENACASASSAAYLASMAVASGQFEVALAVGAERLTHEDKSRALKALASGTDLDQVEQLEAQIYGTGNGGGDPSALSPVSVSGSLFMDIYASTARAYMDRSDATAEDFAAVAVKAHAHGALNPRAQYRDEVTVEQVLQSRLIADPLTLLMCSPIGDGAAAVVFCSSDYAQSRVQDPIRVRAISLVSGRDGDVEGGAAVAARKAYEQAGLGPEDLDIVELHDAAAPAELTLYEDLQLSKPGEAAQLLASGATMIGGRLPVNTSGGLLSKGHPVGATGCAQLVELTEQLRGTAGPRQAGSPRIGLAENGGGYLGPDLAAAAVTILSRDY